MKDWKAEGDASVRFTENSSTRVSFYTKCVMLNERDLLSHKRIINTYLSGDELMHRQSVKYEQQTKWNLHL